MAPSNLQPGAAPVIKTMSRPVLNRTLSDVVVHLKDYGGDAEKRRSFLTRIVGGVDPDELLPFLKDEAERYQTIDPNVSLCLAEALIDAAELAERADHRAFGSLAKGNAFVFLDRCDDALALFDEAACAFECLGNAVGWARTCVSRVLALRILGRAAEGLEWARRAHDVLIQHQQWLRAGGLSLNVGTIFWDLGEYDRALQAYDEAIASYDRARESDESLRSVVETRIAKAKQNKAMIFTLRGDFRGALALHQEARDTFQQSGETLLVLRQDHNIAEVYAGEGHYTRALRLFADVYAGHLTVGWETEAAVVALSLAECYMGLNRFSDALEVAEETVERCERHGMRTEAAKARFYAALALARGGDVERALATLEAAARSFADAGLAAFVGNAALLRASLYLDDANWSAAFRESRNARDIFAERGLVVRQAQAEIVQARASLALADLDVAVDLAHSVQRLVQQHELLWLAHEGQHILAKVAEARGEIDAAQVACEAAIASIERVQGQLAAELRTNFLADKLEVYRDAIAISLRLSRPDQAFAYLERAKSRALVDYLAGNPEVRLRGHDVRSQGLLDELVRLREEHNWLYSRLYGLGLTIHSENNQRDQDLDVLRHEVRDRERRIGRILERLTVEDAESLTSVAPMSTDRPVALPVLEDDTVLVEYYFAPDGGLAFVVSRDGLKVVSLDARPTAIRQLMDRWQLNLHLTARAVAAREPIAALGRNARGLLGMLYRALIQPVEAHLAGYRRLIVIPYGPTHAVPFPALHDGRRYVIETLETSICPSSSLLRLCSGRRRGAAPSALVIAHSNAGRLPGVLEEAHAIAGLFPGECYLEDRATRAALVEAAPRHQLLHLAAHGEARLDNPTFAHLQLADGQLTTVDVFNLDLDGALVTLSACETGRSVVTGGDELVGLSRGFLYAGAATLVQSLWRVDDGSTAHTMAAFYRALAARQSKGAALRAAQLDLLADRAVHPFFWAPFQLIGDHGPL